MLEWEELVTYFRTRYDYYSYLDDVAFMVAMEARVIDMLNIPLNERTPYNNDMIAKLEVIQHYLT